MGKSDNEEIKMTLEELIKLMENNKNSFYNISNNDNISIQF